MRDDASKNNALIDWVWRLCRAQKCCSSHKDKWTVKCNRRSNKYSINLLWAFQRMAVSFWQSQEEGEDWGKPDWSTEVVCVCIHVYVRTRVRITSHTHLASQNKYISWPAVETGSITFTRRSGALSPVATHPYGIVGDGEFCVCLWTLSVRGGFFTPCCTQALPESNYLILILTHEVMKEKGWKNNGNVCSLQFSIKGEIHQLHTWDQLICLEESCSNCRNSSLSMVTLRLQTFYTIKLTVVIV